MPSRRRRGCGSLSGTATTGVHVRLRPFGNGPAALACKRRIRRIGFVTPDSARLPAVASAFAQLTAFVRRSCGTAPALASVSVAWERPTWRVYWQDGPTREALMGRAAALGVYRVGAPLPFEGLRFARSNSAVAIALARGSAESPAAC
jgi:hypothetical protein